MSPLYVLRFTQPEANDLARELQGSFCPCLLSARTGDPCHHSQIFVECWRCELCCMANTSLWEHLPVPSLAYSQESVYARASMPGVNPVLLVGSASCRTYLTESPCTREKTAREKNLGCTSCSPSTSYSCSFPTLPT